ncbi:hypothetical protein HYW19_01465 [Candidatus Woesearchaeota archaeon]|nr:hypothetical protein [Candidatus Woesearchaeota archaeon]
MKIKFLFWIIASFSLVLPNASAVLVDVIQNDVMCNDKNESLQDIHVKENDPNINSNNDLWSVGNQTGTEWFGMVMSAINSSIFPNNSSHTTTVKEAYIIAKGHSTITGGGNVYIHGVQGDELNSTLDEGVTTWVTENPCASTSNFAASSSHCNATWENFTFFSSADNLKNLTWNITKNAQIGIDKKWGNLSYIFSTSVHGNGEVFNFVSADWANAGAQTHCLNITYVITSPTDTTPPEINQNSYNMTSEGGAGCVEWRTNPATPCSTGDTTPTVNFTTTESAWCAIGTQSINFTQYINLGVDRNCTLGQGTLSHTCTLAPDDELTFENSNIYISCRDSSGNENMTGKSTSGPLSLTITGLETGGDSAIGRGVQNALLSGYTNYTNQQIYARKLDGTQDFGTFDWVAKKGSKVWAFNYITSGEEAHVGLFNLTPVLYVLEMSNITNSTIINKVELMINATK